MPAPRTLLDKVWDRHVVAEPPGLPAVLYVDLHLVHEVTSPQAFAGLAARGLKVRRPDLTLATADHSVPTSDRSLPIVDELARAQVERLERNCATHGIPLHGMHSPHQGIVHVIGPELGVTQPGMTIVCGDSHTATHGAFGALAFGIGTSEVEHVLATQTLLQRRPKTFEVRVEGRLAAGVTAKDVILALLARIGVGGGTGHVFEYRGPAIRALSMEQRMTICNMSIEGGARAGMVAPDDTTFEYMAGRPYAPREAAWDRALADWRTLPGDDGAAFDRTVTLDAGQLEPMVTYGTNPGMGLPITGRVPDPEHAGDPAARQALAKALAYMDLRPGEPLLGRPVDVVFIGSCTNSRISDLRQAAGLLRGRKVDPGVRVLVVPGSQDVKRQAEAEGLAEVFQAAGAEWREAGCSMCLAMNGDQLAPGQYAVSTSNRNFEGRQGAGGRTFLASPLTAAASAIAGRIADARPLVERGGVGDARAAAAVHQQAGAAAGRQRRHRPDHPGPVPQGHQQGRAGRGAVRRLALRRRRHAHGRASSSTGPRWPAGRSCSPGPTSGRGRRGSTPPGRSRPSASRRCSRPCSPTSSATTPSRTGCSPSSCRPTPTPSWPPRSRPTPTPRSPSTSPPRR